MNKANQLLDKSYMLAFLRERVLPLYPHFAGIKSLRLIAHKDYVWEGSAYHVVIEYRVRFVRPGGKIKSLPIFCSAHWQEPRRNVYDGLEFLWQNSFSQGYLTVPRPLFYSEEFRGVFYRGVEGLSLYHFIRQGDRKTIEEMLPKVARWFAKLHNLDAGQARNFNQENSRIQTVFPGLPHIFSRIESKFPAHLESFRSAIGRIREREDAFFAGHRERWLIHGDAHPENVIKMGKKKIAFIDYTDLCLADFARDIGAFMQQLEYMAERKIGDQAYTKRLLTAFIEEYFRKSRQRLTADVKERIDNYYYWTALRTAAFFFLKSDPEPERARPLLEKVKQELP